MRRSTGKMALEFVLAVGIWASLGSAAAVAATTYRAFPSSSYWNVPLARHAPVAAHSRRTIRYLIQNDTANYVVLGGASSSGKWGMPVYWARRGDRAYRVRSNCGLPMPRAFDRVRIPRGASPDPTSDAAMTVYNRGRGVVFGMRRAKFDASTRTWSACGGTVFHLPSNGLDGRLRASNDARNRGHRGFAPSTWAVRYDEATSGTIDHVLKISVHHTRCAHVFPAVGDECGTRSAAAPPEGTRIRIRPRVDLTSLGLSPAALAVARALQRYGAVIGDQSGGPVTLKLENTTAEGRGFLWHGVLAHDSLRSIPLRDFQVIRLGYHR